MGLTCQLSSPKFPPHLLARVTTPAELPPTSRPPVTTSRLKDVCVCACPLEPSHRLRCAVASHHRCPPASALVSAAPIGFRGRPLGDEVLEQAAPLAKLPLPNACRGGHRLVLPTRTRSHVGRVRWPSGTSNRKSSFHRTKLVRSPS
jgi:hypothetical protein